MAESTLFITENILPIFCFYRSCLLLFFSEFITCFTLNLFPLTHFFIIECFREDHTKYERNAKQEGSRPS